MTGIRYPSITAKDPLQKIAQVESYLRQLVDQLNMETTSAGATATGFAVSRGGASGKTEESGTATPATFDELKSLIIKSADVVNALYESISKKLGGIYVAQSVYGTFTEQVTLDMIAAANRLSAVLENVQTIESSTNEFQTATRQQINEIIAKADQLSISIQSIEDNGVEKVKTQMGYTFNDSGLRISRDGQIISNLLDNTGMYVTRSQDVVLKANASGVEATDVTVNNYLCMGKYSRFEDYNNGTDGKRTACFYTE